MRRLAIWTFYLSLIALGGVLFALGAITELDGTEDLPTAGRGGSVLAIVPGVVLAHRQLQKSDRKLAALRTDFLDAIRDELWIVPLAGFIATMLVFIGGGFVVEAVIAVSLELGKLL